MVTFAATPGRYVPADRPAIGNMMTLFDFAHPDFARLVLPVRPSRLSGHGPVITNRMR